MHSFLAGVGRGRRGTAMTERTLAEGLTSEVTCPVCLDLFRDPVRLDCEHNFCRPCIGRLWDETGTAFSCPECQEIFPQLRLTSNRLLANIAERVRQLRLDVGSPSTRGPPVCPQHEEKIKLYCQDDQETICVVCAVSKRHKDHRIVPLHEAVQFCQEKLKESSALLAKQVEALNEVEDQQEKEILQLKDVHKLMERARQGTEERSVVPHSSLNIGRFQGPLQYAVWKRMRDIVSPAPSLLTFDPETANPYLILSEDLTAAKYSYTSQQLSETPERFSFCACVLGSEGFTSGRHYWEVEVGDHPDWDVGIAAESADREGWVILAPEHGFWTFGHTEPARVGVYLDHEGGQVSFYRASDMSHLHTFSDTFSERLFPFFYPSAEPNARSLRIFHPLN
ncbi:zinc-binding protein A33-like isoform X3 [Narcine bancroftii]|uniref:zinc-binding protein A33-like isoform X3 n=1 Tax=Narcine bancroftii TaxID=1343680 RepID=UPI003831EAAF